MVVEYFFSYFHCSTISGGCIPLNLFPPVFKWVYIYYITMLNDIPYPLPLAISYNIFSYIIILFFLLPLLLGAYAYMYIYMDVLARLCLYMY